MKGIKVAFTTLGCKVNQDETAGMQLLFEAAGFDIVDFNDLADVYIVNTCTVTHLGSRKSRQMLRQAKRRNREALVVAAGCYPQAAPEELAALKEVDLIVGNSHKPDLVGLVQAGLANKGRRVVVDPLTGFPQLPVSVLSERNRATLKIQDGCQRYCTYCIIPKARGALRSMPLADVLEKGRELAAAGFKEIVLTGINLTSYGKEREGGADLAAVVDALAQAVSPVRIRISSVEPTDFGAGLMEAVAANANVCKDFHVPLQSGSDGVLRRMGRKYSAAEFMALTDSLKERFDRPSFSTDIIVGFPGETAAEFQETLDLVRKVGFCRLHVFRYSPRAGTPAASFPGQVAPEIAARRSQQLIKLGHTLAQDFARELLGSQEEVLMEEASPRPGEWVGYGQRYMRIHCPWNSGPGSLVKVEITGVYGLELLARPLV
ncbi:MAG: tRNA (N(6)-L-threonylcarbamoyladenosine(37)-C(2))-methylthiotransferase MtaB [Eubacteriales bacterium]|nr:tRNA (N(6)-L-threonylcarbamoyladenosine(37)-C(2))-methylthiotransferase MtaB [Eubacteriales bacterium]